MHKRALRRRKKVVRGSRVPLRGRGVRRATGTDDTTRHTHPDADADTTDAQTGSTPHLAPKRRARRRQARTHAGSDSEPHRRGRRRLLLLMLLLLLRLRLRCRRLRLLRLRRLLL